MFIGTHLIEVEFHQCKFKNCALYKAEVSRCYIDPETFTFDDKYRERGANIALQTYHALLANSAEMNQADFRADADFRFRQWMRAQLEHDNKDGKITTRQKRWRYFKSVLYEYLCGFGYRPVRFLCWTIAIFLAISGINHVFLREDLLIADAKVSSFADSIFYSFSVLTILGFSSITPSTDFAKLATVTEAFCAVGWLGLLTSILVKRFLR